MAFCNPTFNSKEYINQEESESVKKEIDSLSTIASINFVFPYSHIKEDLVEVYENADITDLYGNDVSYNEVGDDSNWEEMKAHTEPGIFNLFLIGGKWDITRIINHEKKIGLRVGCNSLNIENKVFEKKLPKLSQIKISWDFGNNPSLIIL